ncbi:MAG: sensor histidine kinase [Bacteroidia bacterium]|nr:sensor histidine kinase [Bacteroidia bacterium]
MSAQKDDQGIISLQQSLAQTEDHSGRVSLMNELSSLLAAIDPKSAIQYAKDALRLAQITEDQQAEVNSLLNLGKAYYYAKNTAEATPYLKKGLDLSRRISYKIGEVDCLNALARVNLSSEWREAYRYIVQARDAAVQAKYQLGIAESYQHLGSWFLEESPEEALKKFKKALDIYEAENNQAAIGQVLNQLGDVYRVKLKNEQEALGHYLKALSVGEARNDERLMTESLNEMGILYQNLSNDYNSALRYYFQAYGIALDYDFLNNGDYLSQSIQGIKDCYASLARLYARNNDRDRADEYDRLYRSYNQMLSNLEDTQRNVATFRKKRQNESERIYTSSNSSLPKDKNEKINKLDQANEALNRLAKEEKISILKEAEGKARNYREQDAIKLDLKAKDEEAASLNPPLETLPNKKVPAEDQTEPDNPVRPNPFLWMGILGFAALIALVYAYAATQQKKQLVNAQKTRLDSVQERANRQEIVLREQEDHINRKEVELAETYVKLDDARLENTFLTQMIDEEIKPPIESLLKELESETADPLFIKQASQHALNTIINIVDVQNAHESPIKLQMGHYAVHHIANQAISQYRLLLERQDIRVENRIDPSYLTLCDAELVKRVFLNLLDNSIRYTPAGGKVTFDAWQMGKKNQDFIKISVSDNGLSIPTNTLNLVFDKFSPEEARPSGLGLVFVKLAIEAHQGQVEAISSPDQGISFIFTLPEAPFESTQLEDTLPDIETDVNALLLLNSEDKDMIRPLLPEFRRLEFFETSALKSLLHQIDANANANVRAWKREMEDAIYNLKENRFKQLIDLADEEA